MPKYQIAATVWGEKFEDLDKDDQIISASDEREAVEEYIKLCDYNANFLDGYPDSEKWEFQTKDEKGVIKRYYVLTDFDPVFCVLPKG